MTMRRQRKNRWSYRVRARAKDRINYKHKTRLRKKQMSTPGGHIPQRLRGSAHEAQSGTADDYQGRS